MALELSKGPIVYALQKYDFFVLFPVNPSTLAKYRQACKPSRAKDDPTDVEYALKLLSTSPRYSQATQSAEDNRELMLMVLGLSDTFQRLFNYMDLIRGMTGNALAHGFAQLPQNVLGVF